MTHRKKVLIILIYQRAFLNKARDRVRFNERATLDEYNLEIYTHTDCDRTKLA